MPREITPPEFVEKWKPVELSERAASQEHFIDLCNLLGQPTPASHDATGSEYTFEKTVPVLGPASRGSKGSIGFVDAWWRGKFAWEYKRKDKYKDLKEAYRQLCQYRDALENPPLLIVSDITHTEIHTNFTGTAKQVHLVELEELTEPHALDLLRRVFTDPDSFKPTVTLEAVTEEVAKQFGTLAKALRDRGHEPHDTAHFLMKCMFCLFAEDVDLLPNNLFERLLNSRLKKPDTLKPALDELFAHMRTGGSFGVDGIPHFNGGLFDESPALELRREDIETLLAAAKQDWGSVEPAIFGTLFERSLDPDTRAQIGAHYTSREDIMLVVEPVVMAPLRREWEEVKRECEKLWPQIQKAARTPSKATRRKVPRESKARKKHDKLLQDFVARLAHVTVLDPACGSGNFLYVAIQQLLDLEKQVITYAAKPEIALGLFPHVRPTQLLGIEINHYAAELAQVVIWIGYLQWMRDHGFVAPADPILEPLQTIECRDAILQFADEKGNGIPTWYEGAQCLGPASWPDADFIIGNPPFLGSKLFRQQGLRDDYIEAMFSAFDLPNPSDLCCYWFELSRCAIEEGENVRVGLLATQGIRGGANQETLKRIKATGDIFFAWSDREWILDGAAVHVSIVGLDGGAEMNRNLDGVRVTAINSDLTVGVDITTATQLSENDSIAFMGDTKGGAFDVSYDEVRGLAALPNPNGRSNLDVVRPWVNGSDITKRARSMWIIDYGCDSSEVSAAGYETPFGIVVDRVFPIRSTNRRATYAERWWIHVEPRPALRAAIECLSRFIITTRVAKHRVFKWLASPTLPDSATFAFARSDNYFFGVLHSSIHELWSLRQGTQLEDRPRYTPTTCFETFPLPWRPEQEDTDHAAHGRIGEGAEELNEQRERWLNPPEWIEPLAAAVDTEDDFADVPEEARALIRESAIMAQAAKDPNLKKRTLTNLYNERPTWLRLAHDKLDRAVLAAYAAVDPDGEWSEDWAEVWTETGAGQPLPEDHELYEKRLEIDQKVLASLMQLNLRRSNKEPEGLTS